MTTYLVTGASGHLGRLTVRALLERGVAASDVVATARDLDAITDLAALGVQTRAADYTDPASLKASLRRGGPRPARLVQRDRRARRPARQRDRGRARGGRRAARLHQHRRRRHVRDDPRRGAPRDRGAAGRVRAARRAAAQLVVPRELHRAAATALEHGAVLGAAGEGRVSAATRADYAAAAAAALVAEGQAGRIHELGGDIAFTLEEYAATWPPSPAPRSSTATCPPPSSRRRWSAAGLPERYAAILADSDLGLARGDLLTESGDLSRLIGRPTTTPAEAIRVALGGLAAPA